MRPVSVRERFLRVVGNRQNRATEALKNTVREWPDDAEDCLSRLPQNARNRAPPKNPLQVTSPGVTCVLYNDPVVPLYGHQ